MDSRDPVTVYLSSKRRKSKSQSTQQKIYCIILLTITGQAYNYLAKFFTRWLQNFKKNNVYIE